MNNLSLVALLIIMNVILPGTNISAQIEQTDSPVLVFIGDTQGHSNWEFFREDNTGVAHVLLEKIAADSPKAIIHLGDMVFRGSSQTQWNKFARDAAAVFNKNIPIFPILGNHEYMGNNSKALAFVRKQFPFPTRTTWYSKVFQDIAILFLNSNDDELNNAELLEQIDWYKQELRKYECDSTIHYIIAVSHHPPFTNSNLVGCSKYMRQYFTSEFEKSGKALAFFSGHCHSYEHFIHKGKHYIVSGGGGGPRQKIKPGAGGKDMPEDLFKAGPIRPFNYCRLYENGTLLSLEVMGYNKVSMKFSVIDSIDLSAK
ncbi:MAG: metallophosphoesterase [Ignavibacteria bacterium]|nr:metallophosphoesterase [Ignavibacteria bacterium]